MTCEHEHKPKSDLELERGILFELHLRLLECRQITCMHHQTRNVRLRTSEVQNNVIATLSHERHGLDDHTTGIIAWASWRRVSCIGKGRPVAHLHRQQGVVPSTYSRTHPQHLQAKIIRTAVVAGGWCLCTQVLECFQINLSRGLVARSGKFIFFGAHAT